MQMKYATWAVAIILCLSASVVRAQSGRTYLDDKWQGSSVCKTEATNCQNEVISYDILHLGPNGYRIFIKTIVNGVERDDGYVEGLYDPSTRTFIAKNDDGAADTVWTLVMNGDALSGDLTTSAGQILRHVELTRAARP